MEFETFVFLVLGAYGVFIIVSICRDKGEFATDTTNHSFWTSFFTFLVASIGAYAIYWKWGEWNIGSILCTVMAVSALYGAIKAWPYR